MTHRVEGALPTFSRAAPKTFLGNMHVCGTMYTLAGSLRGLMWGEELHRAAALYIDGDL